jgi:hypothetical protein
VVDASKVPPLVQIPTAWRAFKPLGANIPSEDMVRGTLVEKCDPSVYPEILLPLADEKE